jgi:hypothetical protein
MKNLLILAIASIVVVGCGSGSGDEALQNAAPQTGADAQPSAQKLDKNAPQMGGPSAMGNQPLAAPGK